MHVLGGPSSTRLTGKISSMMGVPLVDVWFKRFPDSEFYFRLLEDVGSEDLLVVQSLYLDVPILPNPGRYGVEPLVDDAFPLKVGIGIGVS